MAAQQQPLHGLPLLTPLPPPPSQAALASGAANASSSLLALAQLADGSAPAFTARVPIVNVTAAVLTSVVPGPTGSLPFRRVLAAGAGLVGGDERAGVAARAAPMLARLAVTCASSLAGAGDCWRGAASLLSESWLDAAGGAVSPALLPDEPSSSAQRRLESSTLTTTVYTATLALPCGGDAGTRLVQCGGPDFSGVNVSFACPAVVATPVCGYWSAASAAAGGGGGGGAWAIDGCSALAASASGVVCACSHLTDFAARFATGPGAVPLGGAAVGSSSLAPPPGYAQVCGGAHEEAARGLASRLPPSLLSTPPPRAVPHALHPPGCDRRGLRAACRRGRSRGRCSPRALLQGALGGRGGRAAAPHIRGAGALPCLRGG